MNSGSDELFPLLATSNFWLLIFPFKATILEKELRSMKKQYAVTLVLASLVIIALAAVAGSGSGLSDLPAPPVIGTLIDDFKLPDFDGKEHSLNSLKGAKGTVLIFIATKCPVSN